MPFHRFENLESKAPTPDLSSARGPVIEGERLAFGLFDVPAGYAVPTLVSDREIFIYLISGPACARRHGQPRRERR